MPLHCRTPAIRITLEGTHKPPTTDRIKLRFEFEFVEKENSRDLSVQIVECSGDFTMEVSKRNRIFHRRGVLSGGTFASSATAALGKEGRAVSHCDAAVPFWWGAALVRL